MTSRFSIARIYYGWWIVGACVLITLFGNAVVAYGFTSFIQPIAGEFGWSYAQISLAASIRGLETGIAAPVLGWLIDRWGIRKVVFFGSIILSSGLLLLSQTKTLPVFYVAFILIGIGASSCTVTAVMTTIAMWFRKRMGLATGIAISGLGLVGLFLPALTRVIELVGWRSAVLVIMCTILIIVLPLSFLLRHKPEQYGLLPDGQLASQHTTQEIVADKKLQDSDLSIKQALKNTDFWKIALVFTCFFSIIAAVITHVMPYVSSLGVDRYTSSLVASAIPLISIVGRIGLGWFGDKLDKRFVTAGAFGLIGLSLLCAGLAGVIGVWLVVPFFILLGVGYGGGISMSASLTRTLFGRSNFGSILGIIMGIAHMGNLIGPPLAGWVYDSWGTYQWFWLIMAGLAFVAVILILTVSSSSSKNIAIR
jgi:MFS family permease